MKGPVGRKALIGASALALAGALAGAVTLAAGGQDATTRPGAAGTVRAQRVDLDGSSPDGATPSPSTTANHVELRVQDTTDNGATFCVTNAVPDQACTGRLDQNSPDATLQADVQDAADDGTVKVDATLDRPLQGLTTVRLELPLSFAQDCVRLDNGGLHPFPGCDGF